MAINDILTRQQEAARKGPACSVCELLGSLEGPDQKALTDLLCDPTWRYQALSDELEREGIDLGANSLSRHARGRCAARTKLRA